MNEIHPQQGALERLQIELETHVPDNILTAASAKSIRFRISEPRGYAYPDVESFMFEYLVPALQWYADTLHRRDLEIHKLGEELDRTEINLLNLKGQIDNQEFNQLIGETVENAAIDDEVTRLTADYQRMKDERDSYAQGYTDLLAVKAELEAQLTAGGGSTEGLYTHEQVQGYINSAVAEATAGTGIPGAVYSEEEFQAALAAQLVVTATHATTGEYTQEQVSQFLNEQEARLRQELGNGGPTEPLSAEDHMISDLTDGEDKLGHKAQIRILEDSLNEMEKYAKELEVYIAKLEGREVPADDADTPLDSYGMPLPAIRPEDI